MIIICQYTTIWVWDAHHLGSGTRTIWIWGRAPFGFGDAHHLDLGTRTIWVRGRAPFGFGDAHHLGSGLNHLHSESNHLGFGTRTIWVRGLPFNSGRAPLGFRKGVPFLYGVCFFCILGIISNQWKNTKTNIVFLLPAFRIGIILLLVHILLPFAQNIDLTISDRFKMKNLYFLPSVLSQIFYGTKLKTMHVMWHWVNLLWCLIMCMGW